MDQKVAVIKTGGKQYLVRPGDILDVEKLLDSVIELPDMLSGKTIPVKIVGEIKMPKIRVLKFRAKSRYKKLSGHRQSMTKIQVGDW
jgi:large subunit ribosomal protein L21